MPARSLPAEAIEALRQRLQILPRAGRNDTR
jgi:hypothetical protein